jgi:hypothetical protein
MSNALLPLLFTLAFSAPNEAVSNLDFSAGTLAGWEGQGFAVVAATSANANQGTAVTSKDSDSKGRKALLHRAFLVPQGAGLIRFRASACRAKGYPANYSLDVLLLAAGKQIIPKQVRQGDNWKPAPVLLPPDEGRAREYIWCVDRFVGQSVRLVLIDEDDRPGCYIDCSGFEIVPQGELEVREFSDFMVHLAEKHKLGPMVRYDSPHFVALSNADEDFSEMRLRNCERLYDFFWDHFRRKGFALQAPSSKLMVAIFDSQTGFDAYVGHKGSSTIIGWYHLDTNRFVVYDYGQNEKHLSIKNQAVQSVRRIQSQIDRQRYLDAVNRLSSEARTDVNIQTIMHEVAHQLSWNCGLLNRAGAVPFWLAEGLACYCESTSNGSWQGIGEPSPERLRPLVAVVNNKGSFIPLRELVSRNDWMPPRCDDKTTSLAYAQSWALFHMLMRDRIQALRKYFKLVYPETACERQLADFQEAFGSDMGALERWHLESIKKLVQQHGRAFR